MLGVALMFSMAFFVVLAIAALVFWGYLWWKTRVLRQQIQEQMREFQKFDSHFRDPAEDANIIDGEAPRLDERA